MPSPRRTTSLLAPRLLLLLFLGSIANASPAPAPAPAPALVPSEDVAAAAAADVPRGLSLPKLPVVDPLLNLLASPPPVLLHTTSPSPQCAAVNGGELQCCRAMVAGDVQLVVWLAKIYGYQLNPNDINGLNCDNNLAACPGVKVCCQVTTLSPLLSLWCQDYPDA